MTIEQQLKILIDDAPRYGIASVVIQKAIAPVLQLFAEPLQHLEYFILQNLDDNWVLTTISNPKLQAQKKVIYAFTNVKAAATFQNKTDPNIIAAPIPTTHLLFRLFALPEVDSIIFLNNPDNPNQGIEIRRDRLVELIQQQLKQLNRTPPNIA